MKRAAKEYARNKKQKQMTKEKIKETKKGFKEQELKEDDMTDKSKGRERNMRK